MAYTFRTFESIGQTNLDDWNRVHESTGDPFTDPRFLETVERSLGDTAPCRPVIFYDERNQAVAISTVSACRLDAALLVGPRLRKAVGWIRRLWPNYLQFKVAMCGAPVTILQKRLCLLPDADSHEVLRLLDRALVEFAAQQHARVILIGDFDADDRSRLDVLRSLGYLPADSMPAHMLKASFADFQEYCDCLRSNYRRQIRKDRRRFRKAGVSVEHLCGGECSPRQFTDEFYDFYLNVLGRAEFKMTTLPPEFFREVIRQFRDEVHLIRVSVDDQPVAFEFGLTWRGICHLLLIGYDFGKNDEYRLYINTHYEAIDCALQQDVDIIDLGVFADAFKLRLGSQPRPRVIYVKVSGVITYPFHLFSCLLLPAIPLPMGKNVFARFPHNKEPGR